MSEVSKILVVGFDGATLDLMLPWADAGHLPVISGLMSMGGFGRLNSVLPVVSSAAWATFMTGVNPGKHGMYDFVYREPDSYRLRPATRTQIKAPTLWQLLGEQGKNVGVINVPMTYPPEPVNGFIVSGLGAPNFKTFTQPPKLSEDLWSLDYRVNRKVYHHRNNEDEFLKDTKELIEGLTTTAVRLIKENDWDFFMVVYRDTDEVSHGFWHHMDPGHPDHLPGSPYQETILNLYKQLDTYLGQLIEAAGDEVTIFVVSDHGFGPFYKDVFLNEWLQQQSYLFSRSVAVHRRMLTNLGLTRSNVSKTLRAIGLGRVERLIKDWLGDRIEILPRTSWTDFQEGINWDKTLAYSFGYQGQIYLNLKGREPNGIIEPGQDYEKLRDQICADLMKMVDPEDGKPVVDQIYLREDLYHGPHIDKSPDIVVVMRDYRYMTRLGHEFGNQPGEIFGPSRIFETGAHRPDGILFAAGPGIQKMGEHRNDSAWLGDVTPTILHLLDCGIPDWMDGVILKDWLSQSEGERPGKEYKGDLRLSGDEISETSEKEENEMLERLKDLGYLG